MVLQPFCLIHLLLFWMLVSDNLVQSQVLDYPIKYFSDNWMQRVYVPYKYDRIYDDGNITAILLRQSSGLAYACGFFCNGLCNTAIFGVAIMGWDNVSGLIIPSQSPQIIWSANRNNPVELNSTLQFTSNASVVLRDTNGDIVWSTNTDGSSVTGMNLTDQGNLVLFDVNNAVVWESFDHPTDSLAPGQQLREGQRLIASVSSTNFSEGLYHCFFKDNKTHFAIGSNPPEDYLSVTNDQLQIKPSSDQDATNSNSLPTYYRVESDGHMRRYQLESNEWNATDLFAGKLSFCGYPMACGEYGICQNGQCTCPQSQNDSRSYFRQVDSRRPNLGCSVVTPIDCTASSLHQLVEINQVTYFAFRVDISNTSREHCLEACLSNCSCKAAIFRYYSDPLYGECYLTTTVYSLINSEEYMIANLVVSTFLKVQTAPSQTSVHATFSRTSIPIIVGLTVGALFSLVFGSCLITAVIRRRISESETEDKTDDHSLDAHASGVPTKYSLDDLKRATENFSVKIGQGGFGSVFQGSFKDGTKIAVKCLDGVRQMEHSFLAEVRNMGSIHHVNLVRLIGYCAEKSHRLLVYEYMANGSLEKWICCNRRKFPLSWESRRKIVLDIAKGLAYLHEDCRQKIIHFDVKPENILLDENFEAKLSDFGLSKLLSRDQSKIHTKMRGTPGYLAPEWLSSVVTEKADVYSFGVVIMEILCGRKIIDESQPNDRIHLLSYFMRKLGEGKLLEMVDKSCEGLLSNATEVLKMMQIAVWCLQNDFLLRPAMSHVVKVLEGVTDIDLKHLDYNFIGTQFFVSSSQTSYSLDGTLLVPSVLSGPR